MLRAIPFALWMACFCGNAHADPRCAVFLGNSMTIHYPEPAIGWSGHWGMAASTLDHDYVSVATSMMRARGADASAVRANLSGFEQGRSLDELPDALPQRTCVLSALVIFVGDNARPGKEGARQIHALVSALSQWGRARHAGALVVAGTWWGRADVEHELQAAARESGAVFVAMHDLQREDGNVAGHERSISDDGVAAHPGDLGMQRIAKRIVAVLEKQP
jgi:hypothetical protein